MSSIEDMIPKKFIFRSELKFMQNQSFLSAIGMQTMLRGNFEKKWRMILIENDMANGIRLKLFFLLLNEDLEMILEADYTEIRSKN